MRRKCLREFCGTLAPNAVACVSLKFLGVRVASIAKLDLVSNKTSFALAGSSSKIL
jgi:hypothetical protein